VFSIEFIHLFVLAAILRRFGEEGCLWFLLFQEEVERKAEVFTLIAAGLTNFRFDLVILFSSRLNECFDIFH